MAISPIDSRPALQQPDWPDQEDLRRVRQELVTKPSLVRCDDLRTLQILLAKVTSGHLQVIQTGDCAEDPGECTPGYIAQKAALLDVLAGVMKMNSHKSTIRVGRIAGQFGKPRSRPTELVEGVDLPVYRGHMVNSAEPDPKLRVPDPARLLLGYRASSDAMHHLGWWEPSRRLQVDAPVWTSHEALLLDYEIPMVRRNDEGRQMLVSTHWPWIGDRTRQPDGPHVRLLAEVANPVACKVGPAATAAEVTELCERLDPERRPGRLTFIARMGADQVVDKLPPLVTAVRAGRHPAIWMVDPMHGNTVSTKDGLKTRFVETVIREVREFQCAVVGAGGILGGIHLETTPDYVTECVMNQSELDQVGNKYTSLCDPRLNPDQAIAVVSAWRG